MDVAMLPDAAQGSATAQAKELHAGAMRVYDAAAGALASSRSATRWRVLTRAILAGEPARLVGRLLIVSYYFNQAAAAVEAYVHLRTPEAAAALQRWGAGPPPGALRFPWAHVILLLPAASAAAARLPPAPLYAASLLFYTLASDAAMTWGHLKNLLLHRGRPTELLFKQLALTGSAALLLVSSFRDGPRMRAVTAGLLQVNDTPSSGHTAPRRSVLLLFARLLVAALLLYAGYAQALRMLAQWEAERFAAAHGMASSTRGGHHHWGRPDAHDNAWQLLQCVLGVPLALGFGTHAVARALVSALLGEALFAWRWWCSGMPSWHYAAHMREHFFVNAAVAGGLLLLQATGPGCYAVDALLAKRD